MKTFRVTVLFFVLALLLSTVAFTGAQDVVYTEAPMLAEMVATGSLPPVEERLPANPLVVEPTDRVGVYGGTWNMGLRGGNDGALLTRTIGYEGLVAWDPEWTQVIPNIASSWDVNDDGSEYTFYLREGHRWSDGEPFTANDIVFWYEANANNREVSPAPPSWMVAGGEIGVVEALDDYTVKFSFAAPNGLFMQRLATPDALGVVKYPRHFLEQYHAVYNPDGIEELTAANGYDTWTDLWNFYAQEEWRVSKPTLNGWIITSPMTADATQVTGVRNPYFFKVDPNGQQYPYIDSLRLDVSDDVETLVLRALNGEINMQDRHIATLANKAIFFDNQESGNYHFYDIIGSSMNVVLIAFNLTIEDELKNEVFNNRDFRVGLSYAINRPEIIDLVYVGQGEPYQAAPRPTSPFYNERLARQYTEYDVEQANEHLDRVLPDRDSDGFRLGPDGNRFTFSVEVHSVNVEGIDVMELVTSYWRAVGIDAQVNVIDRSIFYDRKAANQHDANIWGGDGGLDVILEPRWYFPFSGESNYAPSWQFWYNGDPRGVEPPEAPRRQMELYDQLKATADPDAQAALMNEILEIAADQFYTIGISLPAPGYGIVANNFHNVPSVMPGAWLYPNPAPTRPFQYFIQ